MLYVDKLHIETSGIGKVTMVPSVAAYLHCTVNLFVLKIMIKLIILKYFLQ